MANEDFHVGNGGSILHLTFKKRNVAFPLDACAEKIIIIRKKDGTILTKTAEFEPPPIGTGDGTDGKIYCTFTTAELDIAGEWKAQGFARFSNEIQVYSSIVTFTVESNLTTIPLAP